MVFHHFPILPNAGMHSGTLPFFISISYRIGESNRLNFQIFMTEIMEVLSRSYKKRPQRISPSRSLRILFFTLWLKSGVRNDTRTDMQRVTNQANFFRIKWLFPLIFRFIVFLDIPISSASERWLYPFNTISDISSLLFTIRLLSPTFIITYLPVPFPGQLFIFLYLVL